MAALALLLLVLLPSFRRTREEALSAVETEAVRVRGKKSKVLFVGAAPR